jgi:hypothetical protein
MAAEVDPEARAAASPAASPATPLPRAPESSWPLPPRLGLAAPGSRSSWPAAAAPASGELPATRPAARETRPSGSLPALASSASSLPPRDLAPRAASAVPGPSSAPEPASSQASLEEDVWPTLPRSSAPPSSGANWPVPAQVPLEPARVLATAWPVAPKRPEPAPSPSAGPVPSAAGVPPSTQPSPSHVPGAAPTAAAPAAQSSSLSPDPPAPIVGSSAPVVAPSVTSEPAPPAKPFSDPVAPSPAPAVVYQGDPFGALPDAAPLPQEHAEVPRREPTGENDSRLATAFEAMPDLYFLGTPVAGLDFTLQLIARLSPCEAVSGCLYDINMDVFRFVSLSGPGAGERRASSVPSQAGLFGVAKRDRGEALLVPSIADEARYDPEADGRSGLDARNMAYLPVRQGGQLFGMLQLINRDNERGFTASDVAVLTYVTTQLADFLASRRLGG